MSIYDDYTNEQLQTILRRRLGERQQERLDYLRTRKQKMSGVLYAEYIELEQASARLAEKQALARHILTQRGIPV